jgi:CHASE1-domain containing sensor protein
MARTATPRWLLLVAMLGSIFLVSIGGVAYTNHVDGKRESFEREADRRWCQLLVTLDDAYRSAPPATETGRRVAGAVHALRVSLKC